MNPFDFNETDPLLDDLKSPSSIPNSLNSITNALSPKEVSPQQLASKAWRLSNLYYITDKQSNLRLFKPTSAQLHFLQNKSFYNIILKSRQLGFTTLATIDMLDNILFRTNFSALLISYDDDSAKSLFQNKVLYAFEHLHKDLLAKYKIDSSRSNMLRLDHGESNYSEFKVDNTGRSGTYNQVHVSEFASICANFPEKVDKIVRGTFPCVHPPFGQITIESTSEGPSGDFYAMFQEASSLPPNHTYRPKEFKSFFYNWQWDEESLQQITKPDLLEAPKEFREIQTKHNELHKQNPNQYKFLNDIQLTYYFYLWLSLKKSWKKLFLEYPLTPEDAFKSASKNIFDLDNLKKLLSLSQQAQPKEVRSGWLFYDTIKANHQYVIGADPSQGIGQDHAAATIIDFTPRIPKVIGTFTDKNTPPDIFAHELRVVGEMCNFALILVERNNHGFATLNTLKGIYPLDYIYKEVNLSHEDDEQTEKLGWHTNLATKPKMFYEFATAVNDNLLEPSSSQLIQEALMFDRSQLSTIKIKDENTTNHFDLITAAAIAYQGRAELENAKATVSIFTNNSNSDPHSVI